MVMSLALLGIINNVQKLKASNLGGVIIETNASTGKENSNVHIYAENNTQTSQDKAFTLTFLGELMMGGQIGESLSYNYMSAFKSIAEYTSKADYTSVNLATNVIDLEKLNSTKSKYIVTKAIDNALAALGVDGVNLASDHMLDFGKDVFYDTVSILKENYDLVGLKEQIVYAEHNGIKVGIIGICNEVIGSQPKYENAGIMMYNMSKIKAMIKEAKQNVNTVIVLTHLGLENTHTVTSIMSWFYKELITAGADAVLGSHALGLYPVEIYKEKPIIYSMGYLMSDTDYAKGKESGIFTININEQGKLESLEIIPLYINAKMQTLRYSEYNQAQASKVIDYLTQDIEQNSYKVSEDKVIIYINN